MSGVDETINGVVQHFGPVDVNKKTPARDAGTRLKELVLPLLTVAGSADLSVADARYIIPAHSLIVDAWLHVKTAFTADTAVSITAGSETDPDGLATAAGIGAKAALTANSWQQGDGALVGAKFAAADESIVAAWNVADASAAGEGALWVQFIPPLVK